METMIVEIQVPAISRAYDFQLPAGSVVRDVISEIINILEQSESCAAFDRDYPMLCHVDDGRILNPNDTIADCGVYDGVKLMLI
ncbi:MAG: EsaB/YukD family protein [Oscillospiraceae bacterium]|nr:EsaB/YukD family protein [Oscillospiraceae bacterium]